MRCAFDSLRGKSKKVSKTIDLFHPIEVNRAPNKSVQATAAEHCSFHALGNSLVLGFVLAQSPAAVPDLGRSAELALRTKGKSAAAGDHILHAIPYPPALYDRPILHSPF